MAFPAQPCVSAHSKPVGPQIPEQTLEVWYVFQDECWLMTIIIQWKSSVCDPFLSLLTVKSLGFSLFSHTGEHWLWTLVVNRSLALGNRAESWSHQHIQDLHSTVLKNKSSTERFGGGKVQFLLKTDSYFRVIRVHFGGSQKEALLRQLTFKSSCFWS